MTQREVTREPVDCIMTDGTLVHGVEVTPARLVSDPGKIHTVPTKYMRDEWFGGFAEGLKGIDETDWDTIKANEGSFKAAYYSTNILHNVVDDIPLSMVEELKLAAFIPTVEEGLAAVHSS